MSSPMNSASMPLNLDRKHFVPNLVDWIALALTIIGGVNWGLVGLLNLDLVAQILGEDSLPARLVYILVGLSAIYLLSFFGRLRRTI